MTRPDIRNHHGEKIDTIVEGNLESNKTLVFVHGFLTNKDEAFNYFVDLSRAFWDSFRVVRFDLSGCGKSEGLQEEGNYQKWAQDLKAVLEYVKLTFPGETYLLAHSMGAFVTLKLSSEGIKKAVFTGIPNHDVEFIAQRLKHKILSRPGGKVDDEGISLYPRTTGELHKIGPSFWKVLKEFNPLRAVEEFSQKTQLLIIHPKQDDVVGTDQLQDYAKTNGVKVVWADGNHGFTRPEDRENLITAVRNFFKQT